MNAQIKPVDDALNEALDDLAHDMRHVQEWVRLHYGIEGENLMAQKLRPMISAAWDGQPTPAVTSAALVRLFGGQGRPKAFEEAANAVHKILRPDDHQGATAAAA